MICTCDITTHVFGAPTELGGVSSKTTAADILYGKCNEPKRPEGTKHGRRCVFSRLNMKINVSNLTPWMITYGHLSGREGHNCATTH